MRKPLARLLALLLTLGLATSACSSGSDEGDASSETGTEQSGDEAAAVDCQEAGQAGAVLRGATGTMIQLGPENEADISLDFVSIRSALETLRPAQDLEGPLGTMRETLDKIEVDLIVLEEKRYDDVVGDYGVASISGIIVDVLC